MTSKEAAWANYWGRNSMDNYTAQRGKICFSAGWDAAMERADEKQTWVTADAIPQGDVMTTIQIEIDCNGEECPICGQGMADLCDDGAIEYYLCRYCKSEYADAEIIERNRKRFVRAAEVKGE